MASGGSERMSSNETFDLQCTTCKELNKNVEAEKYCVDCLDYYCSSCLEVHSTFPTLKGHKLLDKKDGQSGKLLSLPTERCNRHNFKAVDMFCENHDAIGCSTCVAVDHRNCKDVFYIPEFIESKQDVIPEMIQRMDSVEKKLKKFQNVFSDEKNALISNRDIEMETIERLWKELEKKIKEAKKQAIIEVNDKYEVLSGKINGDIYTINTKLESLKATKDLIVSKIENEPQTFVAAKLHESKIAETEKACFEIEGIKLGERMYFAQNNNNDLISNDTFSIGHVNVRPHCFVPKRTVNIQHVSIDESDCDIWGSCVLPDGSVVFADHNNTNIKLLNVKTLTVGDQFQLCSKPTDVCYIKKEEVCVCLPDEKKIKMFRVTDKLLPTNELSLNFDCEGVSYSDKKLYITDGGMNIYEVSMKGQTLRTISPVINNKNFNSLYNICASKHVRNIFVSISTNTGEGVICIDDAGKVLNVVSDKVLWAHGLAEADNGHVLACGYNSKNVILLNETGEYVRTVIGEGLSGPPQSICYDLDRTRLYVSNYKENEVQMFEAE